MSTLKYLLQMRSEADLFRILRFEGCRAFGVRGIDKHDTKTMTVEIDDEDKFMFLRRVERFDGCATIQ